MLAPKLHYGEGSLEVAHPLHLRNELNKTHQGVKVHYQAIFTLCVVVSCTKTGEMTMDQMQWT